MKNLLRTIKRSLVLHEYQSAQLLKKAGLPTLRGASATTPEEAQRIASELGAGAVLKAQIWAGGRGRGHFKKSGLQSGVHVFDSPKGVGEMARKMLGDVLVTKQTGKEGKPVNHVFVVERVQIEREIYLSIMLDREKAAPLIIASPKGGMGIEELEPKYILQMHVKDNTLHDEQVRKVAAFLQPANESQAEQFAGIVRKLFDMFLSLDCMLIEINPLGVLSDGKVAICDTKIKIDDNAAFRQKAAFAMEDKTQRDPIEIKAEACDLNYVKLNGNIGCMVNGAGLAMATMDLINFQGGSPANFLDIGGTADADRVKRAIEIIEQDSDVKAILINIFGGIVRCDMVAEGIIKAVKELNAKKPIIMRIKGTNSDEARKLIKDSGLKLYWYDSVAEAVAFAIKI